MLQLGARQPVGQSAIAAEQEFSELRQVASVGKQSADADDSKRVIGLAVQLAFYQEFLLDFKRHSQMQLKGHFLQKSRVAALIVSLVQSQQNRVLLCIPFRQFCNSFSHSKGLHALVCQQNIEHSFQAIFETVVNILAFQRFEQEENTGIVQLPCNVGKEEGQESA